jgi:hypothetical protein
VSSQNDTSLHGAAKKGPDDFRTDEESFMKEPLNVLLVEDWAEDARLFLRELSHGGFDVPPCNGNIGTSFSVITRFLISVAAPPC